MDRQHKVMDRIGTCLCSFSGIVFGGAVLGDLFSGMFNLNLAVAISVTVMSFVIGLIFTYFSEPK